MERKNDDDKVSIINNTLLFQSYGIKYEIYFLQNEMNSIYSSQQLSYLELEWQETVINSHTYFACELIK